MNAIASQIKHDKMKFLISFQKLLFYEDNMTIRQRLIAIIDLDIFNMKTVCKLADVNYSTFRNAKTVDFIIMSDELVNKLLNTIYMIAKHYPI